MSKNLTRKGLAFGAFVALSVTGVAPAHAVLPDTFVTLAPATGAEYDVFSGTTFDLTANFAQSIEASGQNLKFKITDPSASVRVDLSSGTDLTDSASGAEDDGTEGTDFVEIVSSANNASFSPAVTAGSWISVSGLTSSAGKSVNGVFQVDTVTAETGSAKAKLTYKVSGVAAATVSGTPVVKVFSLAPAAGADGTGLRLSALGNTSLVAAADGEVYTRATDNSFVVNSLKADNALPTLLRLVSTSASTVTSTVQAWVDSNDNNVLDANDEYASPVRTVRFLADADVAVTTTIDPVSVGDAAATAKVTTTPVLNGNLITGKQNRNGAINAFDVKFTRPGDVTELAASTVTWSNTTKAYTATSVAFNSGSWATTAATKVTPGTDVETSSNVVVWKIKVVAGVVTVTTGKYAATTALTWDAAAHGLKVGDTVTVGKTDTNPDWEGTSVKVTSVPTSNTFTYALATATALAETVQAVTNAADTVFTVGTYLRDTATAGTYTAQAYKNTHTVASSTFTYVAPTSSAKAGAVASTGSAAKTADSLTLVGVTSDDVSAARKVRAGIKTASFTANVLDEDAAAVGAGLDALITVDAISGAGTFKVNGTAVLAGTVLYGKTDANGKVAIAVENSSAVAAEYIDISVSVQGVAASNDAAGERITWEKAVFAVLETADQALDQSNDKRAAVKGATATLNFTVQDQFKKALTGDYRLKAVVTGRTETTTFHDLVSGKAAVAVVDNAITGLTNAVSVSVQKKGTDGVWAAATDADFAEMDASGTEDIAVRTINYFDQTDALTLNADGANYPSTTAADFSASTTTKALKAIDLRNQAGSAETYGDAYKAVVSGNVAHSTTLAGKAGAVVTFSGAGLLFKSGDVWSVGSASAIANDGTFSVEVYSNNPGIKTVTVTYGALTKTAAVTYTGASSAVRTLSISGTQKVLPGSTLQAAILLVDGNGNGVDTTAPATTPASEYISVSYEGPGLLSGSALPTETDKDGKASVRYLLGTGDRGVATVTVKFDKNFDGDFIDATDITVTRQYLIGVSAKITKAATSSAVVKNALGASIKVVRGSKVTTKVATSNSQKVTLKGGSGTVKVYVNGVKVASK
jgi:hypothetical protein